MDPNNEDRDHGDYERRLSSEHPGLRITITKIFRFEAAHSLPYHEGKCRRIHGHSYVLHVTVSGGVQREVGSDYGMVMDFGELSEIVKRDVLARLDHQYLNEALPGVYTTAENLAWWIWVVLAPALPSYIQLHSLRLYETDTGYAEITRNDDAALRS